MNRFPRKNQDGMTLLLSVFIMAGMTLIAITVSALAIQSIRNSRAVALSEPAIGAAHSGAEEGVWGLKRTGTSAVPNCSGSPTKNANTLANNLYSASQVCQSYDDATFNLASNVPYTFYLYDPAYPNGVPDSLTGGYCNGDSLLDLSEMDNGGYSEMTISVPDTATQNVSVYVTKLDGITPVGSPGTYPVPRSISPGGSLTISGASFMGTQGCSQDNRKLVKLVYWLNGPTSADSTNVTVSTDLGMPAFPKITSTGCAQRGSGSNSQCNAGEIYSRRIDVTVPQ